MAELITEPEKIITNFSGIENIVNAVLAKMDVPELKGLEEINMVFSAEQFFRLCRTYLPISGNKDEIPQGKYDSVAAFYFKLSDEPQFFIIMKANQFSEILPTYFHEIGHVANDSFLKNAPAGNEAIVKNEMLARCFSLWACEEFNGMGLGYCFPPVFYNLAADAIAARTDNELPKVVRATLATLLNLYIENDSQTAKQFYFSIKDKIYGGQEIPIDWT